MVWRLPGYQPITVLGHGSTGVVMSAHDVMTDTRVAVKYLSNNVARSLDFIDRFRDEIAALVSIEHPNVAQVYEFVEGHRSAAIVTELVEGPTVRQVLDKGAALEPEVALYAVRSALLGIAEGHRRGVVHRDVKPENVIIDTTGVVKVVDFGVATYFRRSAPSPGDPRYLAPELWDGRLATMTSDVYAATAMLFECLTGRPPRAADGRFIGLAGAAGDRDIAAILPPDLPEQVRTLLACGLAAQPGVRPVDANALLDALELAAADAYGPDWEGVGKAGLARRMAASLPLRRRINPARRTAVAVTMFAGAAGTTRALVAAALILVLGAGVLTVSSGAFAPASAAPTGSTPAAFPSISHTPIAVPAPTVPVPSSTGPQSDKTNPQEPTGLHVTGRSQTAVSLDWNPAHDNVKVAGYIVARGGQRIGTTYDPGFTATGLTAKTTYGFTVTAFDAAGNLSSTSPTVFATTLTRPDTSSPSVPAGLHSTGQSTTSIVLAWSASHDDVGVAGYDVFRGGARIATVTHPDFTDTGLTAATTYTYAVRAFDTANNASGNSATLTVATLIAPDTAAPSVPVGLAATGTSDTSIDVTWNASTDNVGVTGYLVFRDGSQVATTAGTSYLDTGLIASTSYSYTVRAFDAAGNTSAASAAQSASTQAPPPPPPTPTPTPTTPPPPPPPPVVNSITLSATPIGLPDCTTTIAATVVVTGGPITVDLHYTINGNSGTTSMVFGDSGGTQTVTLGAPVDGTADVSASADDAVSGQSDLKSWSPLSECIPPPPPPTPSPTDT